MYWGYWCMLELLLIMKMIYKWEICNASICVSDELNHVSVMQRRSRSLSSEKSIMDLTLLWTN